MNDRSILDTTIRLAAFQRLDELERIHGSENLPWSAIAQGFMYKDQRVLFANKARGIFKPRILSDTILSIKSVVPRGSRIASYEDKFGYGGELLYKFQGSDPKSHDNQMLYRALELKSPLIYFCGIAPGVYQAIRPSYIVSIEPENLRCVVSVGNNKRSILGIETASEVDDRKYATRQAKARLHQGRFRNEVLEAYQYRCSICNLPTMSLLEAAHILPDTHPRGRPIVPNGISLCRLHHGAYDSDLLGISADGIIHISDFLMESRDGPVLEYGLKSFDKKRIKIPNRRELRPNQENLDWRFEQYTRNSTGFSG